MSISVRPPRRRRHARRSGRHLLRVVALGVVAVGLSTGCGSGTTNRASPRSSGDIVSKDGIHWHIELRVFVRDRQVEVPANLGIGPQYRSDRRFDPMMAMTGVHTHDTSGTIHWEVMEGPVTHTDMQVGTIFQIWGQPFTNNQVLGDRIGAGESITMTVNGQPNSKLGRYEVHDGDRVDIRLGQA